MLKIIFIFILFNSIFCSNNTDYGKLLEYKKEQIILYRQKNNTFKNEIKYFKEYKVYI